jgi:hypothetical protein
LCDHGTAYLIYWLSGPIVSVSRDYAATNWPWEIEFYDRITEVERKLLDFGFKRANISVDPKNLLFVGDDQTGSQFERQPPLQLCIASPGVPVSEDDLEFQLTPEEEAKREMDQLRCDLECLEQCAESDPAYKENVEAFRQKHFPNNSSLSE